MAIGMNVSPRGRPLECRSFCRAASEAACWGTPAARVTRSTRVGSAITTSSKAAMESRPSIPISLPPRLKNDYWILRHGRSLANEAGIIVSDLVNGQKAEFSLAPLGLEQAKAAGQRLFQELTAASRSVGDVIVLASPFSRTLQTALTLTQTLGEDSGGAAPKVEAAVGLRERHFGAALELHSHDRYNEVWAEDAVDPNSAPIGGESVCQVAHRVCELVRRVDAEHDGMAIILVSHNDTLMILQATLWGLGLSSNHQSKASSLTNALTKHVQFSLETGELRPLNVIRNHGDEKC